MFDEKAIAAQFTQQIMTAEDANGVGMLMQQAFAFLKMNQEISAEMIAEIVEKVGAALNDIEVEAGSQPEKNLQMAKQTLETLKAQL